METIEHFKAKPALRFQRAKIDAEDELYRLSEAELLARLAKNARRLESLQNLFRPDLSHTSEPLYL
jgi:hypothetical protein